MSSENQIRVLPEQVINQIAAGEVIERPAAAVKELLENSLDAGATQVEVEFSGGGKTYIRIEDNGCGMSPEQALLALERHATSKLRRTEDLLRLRTLGFRGEALPSVASISRFTLRTRARAAEHGTELLVDAGRLVHSRQCGLSYGTRIEVAHLFAPVPARRKFLKSDATEGAHITQLVRLHALGRPDVSFHLIENGRTVFRSAACPTMRDRVAEIWGAQLAAELIELPAMQPLAGEAGLRLRGLVGKVGYGRSTRRDMVWLLNGRPIESHLLDNALIDAYEGFLPRGRSPLAFLFLEIDPAAVDVNIHPSKKRVRFGAEGQVRHFVFKTVLDLLEQSVHSTLGGKSAGAVGGVAAASAFPAAGDVLQAPAAGAEPVGKAEGGATPAGAFGATGPHPGDSAGAEPGGPVELREGQGLRPIARRSVGTAPALGGASAAGALPQSGSGLSARSTGDRDVISPQGGPIPKLTGDRDAVVPEGSSIPKPALRPGLAPQTLAGGSRSDAKTGEAGQSAKPESAASPASATPAAGTSATGPAATAAESGSTAAERAQAVGTGLPGAAGNAGDTRADRPQWQFLARLHKEYALLQTPNGLVALRLRAAHERVWFERICNYFNGEACASQQLLLPLSVELDPLAAAALHEHLGFFNAHGFEIEAFGRNFYRIHAHPGWLAPERVEPFVRDCVEYARRGELKQKGQKAALEGLAKLAATRAIRLGDQLSGAQVEALAAALLRCENPLSCPAGKPTLIEWSLAELGRRFGQNR